METRSLPDESDCTAQSFTWTDPATGLQTTLEMKRYTHYPVVEWVQHFKNTGTAPTPILEKIRPMDLTFPCGRQSAAPLQTPATTRSPTVINRFVTPLTADTPMHFAPVGGRPTDHAWPYYNIEQPQQQRGAIVVVAWARAVGERHFQIVRRFSSRHCRSGIDASALAAGRRDSHAVVGRPVLSRRCGGGRRNLWRRWILDCNVPPSRWPIASGDSRRESRIISKREIRNRWHHAVSTINMPT